MAGLTDEEYEKEFLSKVGKKPIRGRICIRVIPDDYNVRCNNCENQAVTGIMITARQRYSLAARKKVVEQAPGKMVYDRTGKSKLLLMAHVVGEVKGAELEDDGDVLIHAEPLTEIGKALFRDLEAGRARCFSMGTGNPEKVDGVDEVGADFKFTGVGIEPTPPKDDD